MYCMFKQFDAVGILLLIKYNAIVGFIGGYSGIVVNMSENNGQLFYILSLLLVKCLNLIKYRGRSRKPVDVLDWFR